LFAAAAEPSEHDRDCGESTSQAPNSSSDCTRSKAIELVRFVHALCFNSTGKLLCCVACSVATTAATVADAQGVYISGSYVYTATVATTAATTVAEAATVAAAGFLIVRPVLWHHSLRDVLAAVHNCDACCCTRSIVPREKMQAQNVIE
jgi:hypothetical protein